MATDVDIVNMALANIGGKSTISQIGETTSTEGIQSGLWYEMARKQALAAFDWSFARKRFTLAAHSEDPPDGVWSYRYQYPADCISMRKIQNPLGPAADAIPFEIELDALNLEKTILTNLDEAVALYTMDLTNTTMYTDFFVEALSHILGSHMAMAVTGKRKIKEDEVRLWNAMIRIAPAIDANERVGPPPREAPWIRARDGQSLTGLDTPWSAQADAQN